MKKYKTIVADPPWQYGKWGKGSDKCAMAGKHQNMDEPLPYPSMAIDEIKALPVSDMADNDCDLYLWTTQKYLPYAFE